jgi:hypothetical protein
LSRGLLSATNKVSAVRASAIRRLGSSSLARWRNQMNCGTA